VTERAATDIARALRLLGEGKLAAAGTLAREILQTTPESADALQMLAICEASQGRVVNGRELLQRAVTLQPDRTDLRINLAKVLERTGACRDALEHLAYAGSRGMDIAPALRQLARRSNGLGDWATAIAALEESVRLLPGDAAIHTELGKCHLAARHLDDAETCFRRAIALDPKASEPQVELLRTLIEAGRPADAVLACRDALALRVSAERLNALGSALMADRRAEEAIAAYEQAIALEPKVSGLHWNLAQALLKVGDFERGWRAYEARRTYATGRPPREPPQPRWTGKEPLAGKSILLQAEQGFGDTIQFARFVPLLARRGARVLLHIYAPLIRLLSTLDGVDDIIAREAPVPATDYFCPLGSLPLALQVDASSIPADVPYLHPDRGLSQQWASRLPSDGRPRVGICWSGRPTHVEDRFRSMRLECLRPLLQRREIHWICLQNDVREYDRSILAEMPHVLSPGPQLVDFADTAALADNLDLVLSVDSSPAHLAGALAIPLWLMLPYNAEYRWLDRTDRSAWYPTARLFRQHAPLDWAGVVFEIGAALSTEGVASRRTRKS